jgi:hypothetical protein
MPDAQERVSETKVVWKFGLHPGEGVMYAPEGAEVLYVAVQREQCVAYVLCEPAAERRSRRVLVVPTGEEFDATGLQPAGLLALANGTLMYHVFVETRHA